MKPLSSIHNPNFYLLQINNNRTAWRPFGTPMILVVPHRRAFNGAPQANSEVWGVRIYIEDVPREARVAGHDHVGMRFPDRELYAESISTVALSERFINLNAVTILRDGEEIDYADAETGDIIRYTTASGVTDDLPFLEGADYYDLSDIKLEVEQLPADKYNLVYEASFYERIISQDDKTELLCLNPNSTAISNYKFQINHPGDVIGEMYRLTPPHYLTNATKAEDTTIAFYRPFADAIQDIVDEQGLLQRSNWILNITPQSIPYLSALLGWDIPYFPQSLDRLRTAVVRKTVELQSLKGSRRAIIDLFRLFGFEIRISNLWWSADGSRLIRINEILPEPYTDQQITITEQYQFDVILSEYSTEKFKEFTIPLLYRPQEAIEEDDFTSLQEGGDVTIDAYLVDIDSPAYTALQTIAAKAIANPSGYGEIAGYTIDTEGFINQTELHNALSDLEVVGYSQILISGRYGKAIDEILAGQEPPFIKDTCSLNRDTNALSLTLNGAVATDGRVVFAFVGYFKQQVNVPDALLDLQSNRFDIQVVSQNINELVDPVVMEFALEFLYRLKAFHSLLNLIKHRIELNETYAVTDICAGGDSTQRYDTDMGLLQVPPAITPNIPSEVADCTLLDPRTLGYKDADILMRLRIITSLVEEHARWKDLDGREEGSTSGLRLDPNEPIADRDNCVYTPYGQDRITGSRTESRSFGDSPDLNANQDGQVDVAPPSDGVGATSNSDSGEYGSFIRDYTEVRSPQCELDGETDYCYKGRVSDEVLHRPAITLPEIARAHPCDTSLGIGTYWTFPARSVRVIAGNDNPTRYIQRSGPSVFSGGATTSNERVFLNAEQREYLEASYSESLPKKNNSLLGRLLQGYGVPSGSTLHYSNRPNYSPSELQSNFLALQRPSLDVQHVALHFPGCRFISMNSLQDDFTHPTWRAKPWDDQYSVACGPVNGCSDDPTFLNATFGERANGDTYLIYDDVAFSVVGNNIDPDIPSLGSHTGSGIASDDVVHKVYMDLSGGHEAISLDGVCDFDTSVGSDGIIDIADPLFNSYADCGTNYRDFAEGYPCSSGFQSVDSVNLDRDGLYSELFDALDIPTLGDTDIPDALFYFGSGIRVDTGMRLDCGCSVAECDSTVPATRPLCDSSMFLDQDGVLDWNCDHIEITRRLVAQDTIGAQSYILDGTIPSLLELA